MEEAHEIVEMRVVRRDVDRCEEQHLIRARRCVGRGGARRRSGSKRAVRTAAPRALRTARSITICATARRGATMTTYPHAH